MSSLNIIYKVQVSTFDSFVYYISQVMICLQSSQNLHTNVMEIKWLTDWLTIYTVTFRHFRLIPLYLQLKPSDDKQHPRIFKEVLFNSQSRHCLFATYGYCVQFSLLAFTVQLTLAAFLWSKKYMEFDLLPAQSRYVCHLLKVSISSSRKAFDFRLSFKLIVTQSWLS